MYIINKQMRRIFNTDNLQVVLISPDDRTKWESLAISLREGDKFFDID